MLRIILSRRKRDMSAWRQRVNGKEAVMRKPTRRSVLRASLGLIGVGAVGAPYVASAQAKTATVWWVQGFAHEEDIAFQKRSSRQ